jgi:hypothetical protein
MALARLGSVRRGRRLEREGRSTPERACADPAIAACCLALAGRLDEALGHAAAIRRALPQYRVGDFLTAMQFAPEDQRLFREAAKRIGLD